MDLSQTPPPITFEDLGIKQARVDYPAVSASTDVLDPPAKMGGERKEVEC